MKQLNDCPTCGASHGWFTVRRHSYEQYYDANGEPSHAADRGIGIGGKRQYCAECGYDITACIGEGEGQHDPDCDVLDANPDGIRKPCNCGTGGDDCGGSGAGSCVVSRDPVSGVTGEM